MMLEKRKKSIILSFLLAFCISVIHLLLSFDFYSAKLSRNRILCSLVLYAAVLRYVLQFSINFFKV